MLNKYWPQLRAILISIHLIAIILKAIPSPEGAMNRSDWKNPTVQAEFEDFTNKLNTVGLDISQAEVEEELWVLAKKYMKVRRTAVKPFRKYYRYAGADQNWQLFVAPHMYPSRLNIEILVGDEWQTVYQPFNPETRWQAHLIENSRFRPSIFRYSWPRYKKHYHTFVKYLAGQAVNDFPTASRLRTRWWNARSPSPEQVLNNKIPEGKWQYYLLFDLDEIRMEQKP
jgi:hypothetical protein